MKNQEQLCIDKYTKYKNEAKSQNLKNLFDSLASTEREHLNTVNVLLDGSVPPVPVKGMPSAKSKFDSGSYSSPEDKKADALLLRDMLAMEKHVSSLYDTSIFEFISPDVRAVLNHIQTEEQEHGERLYSAMSCMNAGGC